MPTRVVYIPKSMDLRQATVAQKWAEQHGYAIKYR